VRQRGQAERLDELLNEDSRDPSPAALVVGALGGGYLLPPSDGERGLRVLTDHEIFRRERRIRRARRYVSGGVDSLALKPGDYVVHLEHGVGIYRGIETIFVGQSTIEVAVVEYEGGDRLNVPLYRIDQLERYRSSDDVSDDAPPPRLHKLGGRRWAQQRDRTRAAIQEMTIELSTCMRAQGRLAAAARAGHAVAEAAREQLPVRGHARPAQGDVRSEGRHGEHASDGSPARRRRRLRQDRDRRARRVQGGAERTPGGGARTDHHPRRPARAHVRRAARRLPDPHRGDEPLPERERSRRRRSPSSRRARSTS
jgi:hypothetical protein